MEVLEVAVSREGTSETTRIVTIGGASVRGWGVKSNCAPPVDSPHLTSQQIIAAIDPVGEVPSAQQAISLIPSQSPWLCMVQTVGSLRLLLMASTPQAIPPAIA